MSNTLQDINPPPALSPPAPSPPLLKKSGFSELFGAFLVIIGLLIFLAELSFSSRFAEGQELLPEYNLIGHVGHYTSAILFFLFGSSAFLLGPYLLFLGVLTIYRGGFSDPIARFTAVFIMMIGSSIAGAILFAEQSSPSQSVGGLLGSRFSILMKLFFGHYGTLILSFGILLSGIVMAIRIPVFVFLDKLKQFFQGLSHGYSELFTSRFTDYSYPSAKPPLIRKEKSSQRPWIDRVEDPSPVKNSNTQNPEENPEENPKEKTKENLWKSAASNRILEHTRRLQSVLSDFKGNSFPPKQSDSPQKKEEALPANSDSNQQKSQDHIFEGYFDPDGHRFHFQNSLPTAPKTDFTQKTRKRHFISLDTGINDPESSIIHSVDPSMEDHRPFTSHSLDSLEVSQNSSSAPQEEEPSATEEEFHPKDIVTKDAPKDLIEAKLPVSQADEPSTQEEFHPKDIVTKDAPKDLIEAKLPVSQADEPSTQEEFHPKDIVTKDAPKGLIEAKLAVSQADEPSAQEEFHPKDIVTKDAPKDLIEAKLPVSQADEPSAQEEFHPKDIVTKDAPKDLIEAKLPVSQADEPSTQEEFHPKDIVTKDAPKDLLEAKLPVSQEDEPSAQEEFHPKDIVTKDAPKDLIEAKLPVSQEDDPSTQEEFHPKDAPKDLIEAKLAVSQDASEDTKKLSSQRSSIPYELPLEILGLPSQSEPANINLELESTGRKLINAMREYGIQGKIAATCRGPILTLYEIKLEPGIKVSRVIGIQNEICMNLEAPSIRIIAPIPGKSTIGIEIPNTVRSQVLLRQLLPMPKGGLNIIIGQDISGKNQYAALNKLPHLLIAGATGAGKSVYLNTVIASLLYAHSPEDIRFVMIDPKMVELKLYEGIPHLLLPVITDVHHANKALRWLVDEMERRYMILSRFRCRDICSYHSIVSQTDDTSLEKEEDSLQPMPYIVVFIDELSDLMMVAAKEVEDSIIRLTQKARAVGIHIIMATQRPSVDVITALIKANCPARVSFQVAQRTDSRTILDANGAENLLGRGDSLYKSPQSTMLTRIQAPLVSESEIEEIVKKAQSFGKPKYADLELESQDEGNTSSGEDDIDESLFQQALDIVLQSGKTSTSYLQRRMRIGYNRSANLIEMMEQRGYLSHFSGNSPREILKRD